jgi:glycosyltransferase involved in cell wall biosynthesis
MEMNTIEQNKNKEDITIINRKIDLSIVIPVYNEESNLSELYLRLTNVMSSLGFYEIIFVDDGSKDSSFDILKGISHKDVRVRVIKLVRNFGQHAALSAGLKHTSGDIVITMDSDLQNPPEEIPRLLGKLNEGFDLVFGTFEERSHSMFRKLGSKFAKIILSKIMGDLRTNISTFRAIRSSLVKRLNMLTEKSRFLDGLMIWIGATTATVSVRHEKRSRGETKYNLPKLVKLWFDMVTSFSDFPLKFATYSGLLFGVLSFMLAGFYLARKLLLAITVPGFATIIIIILFFSGIQLFCIGMVGEYIGRIFIESKNRPLFIIEKTCGFGNK